MRILYVLEHYQPYIGGSELLFKELTESMAAKGHKIEVITTKFDRSLSTTECIAGVKIKRLNVFNRYLFTFFSIPSVIKAAKSCDIIHTTSYNAAPAAWIASKVVGKPCIITFHEVWGKLWHSLPFITRLQKWGYFLFEKFILSLSFDFFVAVSNHTKSQLIRAGISPDKIIRIYNGLAHSNFDQFKHTPPKEFTFTYFGRLGISKGLDILIPAANRFCLEYTDSIFNLIIPKKPTGLFNKVSSLIDQNRPTNFNVFHNLSRHDLFHKVCKSSCVVIPSYAEGFCFVAAESAELGIPIITSERGALEEVVSGKKISIDSLNENGIYEALKAAKDGKWQEVERKTFEMNDFVQSHISFYKRAFPTKKNG